MEERTWRRGATRRREREERREEREMERIPLKLCQFLETLSNATKRTVVHRTNVILCSYMVVYVCGCAVCRSCPEVERVHAYCSLVVVWACDMFS